MDSVFRLLSHDKRGYPIRSKLLLTLRPYAYGEDVFMDDISGNLGEDVVVEWRELYGEDVPIVAYMIPEDMQAEMFAIFGEGLWFDSEGTAKQVNIIELAQSPEINLWAVWHRLYAAAGLGNLEVLFYHPDLITVADVTKIAAWFKDPAPSALSDAILYYDAEADTDRELTGGPSTFNSSIIGTQYRRNADGTYTAVPAGGPIVDTFEDGFVGLRSCGAVTNLLTNSVFQGAVSGTPGTAPTGWTNGDNGGSLTLSGQSLTFTSVASRRNIRQTISGAISTPYLLAFTAACDGTLPIQQICTASTAPSGSTYNWYVDGVSRAVDYVPSIGIHNIEFKLTVSSTPGNVQFVVGSGANSNATGTVTISNPQLTATAYPQPYVPTTPTGPVTQPASNATTSGGNWFTNPDGSPLWQSLTGAPHTLATRIRMGVGSGDLLGVSVEQAIFSVSTTDRRLTYFRGDAVESSSKVIATTDGVSFSNISSTWTRNTIIRRFIQVNTAGTQFRVGYMIEGTHTAIQWSVWVTYDGSFNPSTLYRLMYGYNNAYPMWLNKLAVWKRQVPDTELLEVFS